MALRMDGDWHVSDGPSDLGPFLYEIGADGNVVHEVRHCVCADCGGDIFGVVGDPDGHTMRRTCRRCENEHYLAGCEPYWSDIGIHIMCCPCGEEDFNLALGFSLYPDEAGI